MPRSGQSSACQRFGTANCMLHSPLARGERALPLHRSIKSAILASELPGIWRMSVETR
jgi:hypothetical protein